MLQFRNLVVTPDDPVDQWGVEGVLAALDRGTLKNWRKIAAAVRSDPHGRTAEDLDVALRLAEDRGAVAIMTRVLARARREEG
ncbi:hypothetical protein SAMN04488550_1432 [Gordonia malaquae]|uniref:Uncharacterized protein n=1 Tax=Gordonia malaquae NBRC 108250 TaxID=1223542 RepID=M3UMV5_GORML|nr:hypothetical protein [Gordonia malaquae]GAC81280.1 hypothetical protein GM1_031_00330 [Gordonia malaquae NBRC 108250]SEC17688.1 hypothetical protein SAMN04488550_1432 [Gordonia malaquae]